MMAESREIVVAARSCGCDAPLARVQRVDYRTVKLHMSHFPTIEAPEGLSYFLDPEEAESLGEALMESAGSGPEIMLTPEEEL
jgi:hypothetical protein